MDDVQLPVLPASDTEKETEDIRLFSLVKLFDVFVGTHLDDDQSEREDSSSGEIRGCSDQKTSGWKHLLCDLSDMARDPCTTKFESLIEMWKNCRTRIFGA